MTVGIDEGAVIEYIVTTFPDLQCEVVQGNWFFFRGADRKGTGDHADVQRCLRYLL